MSWRQIGAVNSRYEQVAQPLGVTFVDLNSWLDSWDYGRDGLHINQRGARHLGQLYSRLCGISSRRQKMRSE
jgi:lysophospholipase L1-like esterase